MDDVYVTPFRTNQRAVQRAVVFGPWGALPVELEATDHYPDGSVDVCTVETYGNTNAAHVKPGREIWKWGWK